MRTGFGYFAGLACIFDQGLAADVGSHDNNGVLEVDRPALAVGKASVVQDLQQVVEHIVVSLLDLIKQNDASKACAARLPSIARLLHTQHIPGRANQPRDRVFLHVLTHIHADDVLLGSNRDSARALANSVLPTPVGPRKMNEPIGPFRIF